ncbi:hypothetical protein T440DRAFT_473503 [Plenodomus tracheiphilus IPT5]|uniref:Pentatricopeptide repeat-containing protein-mitochondrial domain-containing protein n=1 Tax=Plenodomus tracheiphilus IPT5 TaxID=1408161 RepID=A0A6A7APQ3_9PLEO|nr:hypothetical protein T440DRAFT_473503 [Plenodomus tracheiphilus IPT5]
MPPHPFVNDGLWRCLCPGFPPNATPWALFRAGAPRSLHQRPNRGTTTSIQRRQLQSRAYNTNAPFTPNESFNLQNPPKETQPQSDPTFNHRATPSSNRNVLDHASLVHLPTYTLYEKVRAEGAKGNFEGVLDICRVLINDKGETRNIAMYTAVLHSFVSSTNGTAGKLRKVLDEMGFWDVPDAFSEGQLMIELDARACECALEVLAVHPDYLLREEILEYMKTRWFTLSDRGRNFVVAGMLRERHFELALNTLEDMVKNKARVENWLFIKAMWMLLEFEEVEEAFYVLSLKEASHSAVAQDVDGVKLSQALWGSLLDAAAQKQLHEPVNKVWMTQVQPGYLKPGTGACLSVLMVAALHGDIKLATDVFRVLIERDTNLTSHHYELLISTYLKADDMTSALSVILIMVENNFKVDDGTCRPLFMYLSAEKPGEESRPMQAFKILQSSEAAGRKIPTDAVNACIQASVSLKRVEEALEIYKALHTVSEAGPNTRTFNNLFRGCVATKRKELAMFLANEMIELGLKPDRITYDRLILVCLESDDLEDAILYYEELTKFGTASRSKNNRPRRSTWELLITKCVQRRDERAVALLEAYKQNVEEPRTDVERAVMAKFRVEGWEAAGEDEASRRAEAVGAVGA